MMFMTLGKDGSCFSKGLIGPSWATSGNTLANKSRQLWPPLNRLEVVETGRRRRWSEEEKAPDRAGEHVRSAFDSNDGATIWAVAFSAFDLAEGAGGGASQTRDELCQSGCS